MQTLLRSLLKPPHHHHHSRHCYLHRRTLVDFASIKHVRDRGLDHAVERERHLKPVLNLKNLIKQEPSKSLPISVISQQKDRLSIPTRPIEFIRRYPSIFEEFLPGGIGILPHVKLTPQVLDLDAEEQLVYQRDDYRQDVANRLLKLLMISRIDKIPLEVIDLVKFDLGLPQDFVKSVVPDFPDCFRISGPEDVLPGLISDSHLELVCWNNELAISVIEKKAKRGEMGSEKGLPISFSMQFSRGFEMDKQLKKWLDDWQKLPYVSPYENAQHLGANSDESDKWTVAVLHEILNLFVAKKVERDILLHLGECLGIRSRFKRAFLHHPGIFYLSNKMGTYTVVLKEAYKRGTVTEENPLMDIRNQYVHLMNKVIDDHKVVSVPGGSKEQEKKTVHDEKQQKGEEDGEGSLDGDDMGSDFEDDSDDGYEYSDDEEETEGDTKKHSRGNAAATDRRADRKNLDLRRSSFNADRERSANKFHESKDKLGQRWTSRDTGRERYNERHHGKFKDRGPSKDNFRTEKHNGNLDVRRSARHDGRERTSEDHHGRTYGRLASNRSGNNFYGSKNWDVTGSSRNNARERTFEKHHGRTDGRVASRDNSRTEMNKEYTFRGKKNLDKMGPSRSYGRERSAEKHHGKIRDKVPSRNSTRTEMHKGHNFHESSQERSVFPKGKGRSSMDKRTTTRSSMDKRTPS